MKITLRLIGFSIFFCRLLVAGESFILINGNTSEVIQEFGPNIYKRVTPASTFKIALSLIGFDTGILENEISPVWDFQEGYDNFLETWNQDIQAFMSDLSNYLIKKYQKIEF